MAVWVLWLPVVRSRIEMNNKKIIYHVSTAFVAALGGLLFGFDMSVISVAIPFNDRVWARTFNWETC